MIIDIINCEFFSRAASFTLGDSGADAGSAVSAASDQRASECDDENRLLFSRWLSMIVIPIRTSLYHNRNKNLTLQDYLLIGSFCDSIHVNEREPGVMHKRPIFRF